MIVEPDAVALALEDARCQEGIDERFALLRAAVLLLAAQHGTSVYLDAGSAGWVNDMGKLADGLGRAGIEWADEFSLNVSNFQTTSVTVDYGNAIVHR